MELCEQEGIRPAPYVGRYKWVLLEKLDVLADEMLRDLIRQSYDLVVAKGKGRSGVKVGKVKAKVKIKDRSTKENQGVSSGVD